MIRASLTAVINSEDISSTNYKIAKFLLENNYLVNRISIQDVADKCFCSKSTISRFCRQLGYENYYEMNQDLYVSTQKSQDKYIPYIISSYNENIEKYFSDLYLCIEYAKKYIKEKDVNELVKNLMDYNKIAIFGNLQSHSVGQLFQEDLGLCRKIVTASILPENQKSYIQQADRYTLILIVSCSGSYFRNFIDVNNCYIDNKPRFILITNNEKMVKNPFYDKIIYLPCNNNYVSQPRIIDFFFNIIAINYAKHIFLKG
jgi:DNA-binding MurR/RpiR family transcriptional regulator